MNVWLLFHIISFACLFSIFAISNADLDILNVLNITDDGKAQKGVVPIDGADEGSHAWRLHSAFDNVQIPHETSAGFMRALNHTLSFVFIYRQHKKSIGTLISMNSPGKLSPWLRLTSNTKTGVLVLTYRMKTNGRARHKMFKLPHKQDWLFVGLTLGDYTSTFYADCHEPVSGWLLGNIELDFPDDTLMYFRQEPGIKKKLLGSVQAANVSTMALAGRPWRCEPMSDIPHLA